MQVDVKFVVTQLRDSKECGGWQYVMTPFFLSAVWTPGVLIRGEDGLCLCARQVPSEAPERLYL